MEKDFFGSWSHHQHSNRLSPNLDSSCPQLEFQQNNFLPAYLNTSTNGTLPMFSLPGLPLSTETQLNEPHGWFYGLPRFRQGFAHTENSIKEKFTTDHNENQGKAFTPNMGSECAKKKFLVFDQSGDQTTLIFNSGIGTYDQLPNSWTPKPIGSHVLNRGNPGKENFSLYRSAEDLTNEYGEKHVDDMGSEMHEDTEEINALLYSDDETDYSEDEEVSSTGHSPGAMTACDDKGWTKASGEEEVAISFEPSKRQKLFDGGYDVPSLTDSASSVKPDRCSEYEDDAESSCADVKNNGCREFDFLLGDKRSCKEKIREKVSVIKSILPVGKSSDVIGVLDEAIGYLRSLKCKADALGLNTPSL